MGLSPSQSQHVHAGEESYRRVAFATQHVRTGEDWAEKSAKDKSNRQEGDRGHYRNNGL